MKNGRWAATPQRPKSFSDGGSILLPECVRNDRGRHPHQQVRAMATGNPSVDAQSMMALARGRELLAEAASRGARLRPSGSEWIGPCPVCGGRDRFAINTRKSLFNCRG